MAAVVRNFADMLTRSSRLLLAPAVAVGIAGLVIWSVPQPRPFLLAILAILVPLPVIVRALQRKFDPFEPIVLLAVSFFMLFVVRPIAHLAYGETRYAGIELGEGFDKALLIATVGVVAVYVGYSMSWGRAVAERLKPLPNALKPEAAIAFASSLVVIGVVLYGVYVWQIGGLDVAKALLKGRDPLEGRITSSGTVYFLFGPFLAIPATLLLLEAAAAKRRALAVVLVAAVTGLSVVLITSRRGDRLWLMLLFAGVFALPYLRRQKRPSVRLLAAVAVLWFGFGITFLSEVRVPTARAASPMELLQRTAKNPLRGWHDFVLGADTEMFPVMALMTERVPSLQPHEVGITLRSLATNWIPRKIYPTKPFTADEKIYAMLFPTQASYSKAGTAPSIFGGFYYDSGFFGLVAGSFVVGLVARILFQYFAAYPRSAGVRLLYASTLPFVVVLVRGNPTDTIARMSFIVFPIIVAVWFAGRREPRRVVRGDAAASVPT